MSPTFTTGPAPTKLFNFLNIRLPQQISDDKKRARYATYLPNQNEKSPYYKKLESFGTNADFVALPLAIRYQQLNRDALSILSHQPADNQLQSLIDAVLSASNASDISQAKQVLQATLGMPVQDYLNSTDTKNLIATLWDCVYANALATVKTFSDTSLVYQALRAIQFLNYMVTQLDTDKPLTQQQLMDISITLSYTILRNLNQPAPVAATSPNNTSQTIADLNNVLQQVISIDNAIQDLAKGKFTYRMKRNVFPPPSSADSRMLFTNGKSMFLSEKNLQNTLQSTTIQTLNKTLSNWNILEIDDAALQLQQAKYQLVRSFINKIPSEAAQIISTQPAYAELLDKVPMPFLEIAPIKNASSTIAPVSADPSSNPTSFIDDRVRVLGVGDLHVVQERILSYRDGDIAHIENVMATELREYSNVSLNQTKTTDVTSTTDTKSSSKDLQTTDRNEMSREAQNSINKSASLNAGLTVSASYGPTASVTANTNLSMTNSTSSSDRSAVTMAKQIVDDAKTSVITKTFTQRVTSTLDRFEERNKHQFNNSQAGSQNVVGIYRWVDKYMQSEVINYGRRLMLEFILPEPAAYYTYLMSNQQNTLVDVQKPILPTIGTSVGIIPLTADYLTRDNYNEYISQYNVPDAVVCPAEKVKISTAMAEVVNDGGPKVFSATSEELQIPEGYEYDSVQVIGDIELNTPYSVSFGLGNNTTVSVNAKENFLLLQVGGDQVGYFTHNGSSTVPDFPSPMGSTTNIGIKDGVPISAIGIGQAYQLGVVVTCKLSSQAYREWQLNTYASIMTAYTARLSEYNTAVAKANAATQTSVQIQGRNPGINKDIIQNELKKGVLRLLTNNFDAIRINGIIYSQFSDFTFKAATDAGGLTSVSQAVLEGKVVQFFQQAFEWTNMTYLFYPYFWGRKEKWQQLFTNYDVDPDFTDFLRAGSARVVVPVPLAYNNVVMNYLTNSEIWSEAPLLGSALYLSIDDELKADQGAEIDDATLQANAATGALPRLVDSWTYKLPTTLVHLQQDGVLPDFTNTNSSSSSGVSSSASVLSRSFHTSARISTLFQTRLNKVPVVGSNMHSPNSFFNARHLSVLAKGAGMVLRKLK